MEAEYYEMSEAAKEVMILCNIRDFLNFKLDRPIVINTDVKSAYDHIITMSITHIPKIFNVVTTLFVKPMKLAKSTLKEFLWKFRLRTSSPSLSIANSTNTVSNSSAWFPNLLFLNQNRHALSSHLTLLFYCVLLFAKQTTPVFIALLYIMDLWISKKKKLVIVLESCIM